MSNKDIIFSVKVYGALRPHQYGGFSPMRSQHCDAATRVGQLRTLDNPQQPQR